MNEHDLTEACRYYYCSKVNLPLDNCEIETTEDLEHPRVEVVEVANLMDKSYRLNNYTMHYVLMNVDVMRNEVVVLMVEMGDAVVTDGSVVEIAFEFLIVPYTFSSFHGSTIDRLALMKKYILKCQKLIDQTTL